MPSFYTIVHYVPDPIADERMNVGVIVCGEGGIKANFIKNWRRARGFGKESVTFLREFADQIKNAQLPLLPDMPKCDEATLRKILGSWRNSIQFSEPRASLKSPDDLMEEVSRVFLREASLTTREARGKHFALAIGAQQVGAALHKRFGKVSQSLLKKRYTLEGRMGKYPFDIVVANGRPFFGAETISYEISDLELLRKETDAAAFAIEDVKRKYRNLPLAVIALPPRDGDASYQRARKIFKALGVDVVPERKLENWAEQMVKTVDSDLFD